MEKTMEQIAEENKVQEEKVQEFLVNRDKEETELTLQFAKALLATDLEIKEIKNDQKEIKKQAKDEGVSVQKVTKALNQLKAIMKANDSDLNEIEEIENVLGHDVDIRTQIAELVRKD
jgi:DNA-binding transcriptional MerR regulator